MAKKSLNPLLILLSFLLTCSPLITFADDSVEGSALDSMEDLVSDLDEDLSEADLATALAAEKQEAEPEEPSGGRVSIAFIFKTGHLLSCVLQKVF